MKKRVRKCERTARRSRKSRKPARKGARKLSRVAKVRVNTSGKPRSARKSLKRSRKSKVSAKALNRCLQKASPRLSWELDQDAKTVVSISKVLKNGQMAHVTKISPEGFEGENTVRFPVRQLVGMLSRGEYQLSVAASVPGKFSEPQSLIFRVR